MILCIYICILLRPWSTAQISQEQQDLGSWVVISFRVRDPKSDGCEVLPRMDFWGPSSKQFRGPQKKRSPTSRVSYINRVCWINSTLDAYSVLFLICHNSAHTSPRSENHWGVLQALMVKLFVCWSTVARVFRTLQQNPKVVYPPPALNIT